MVKQDVPVTLDGVVVGVAHVEEDGTATIEFDRPPSTGVRDLIGLVREGMSLGFSIDETFRKKEEAHGQVPLSNVWGQGS